MWVVEARGGQDELELASLRAEIAPRQGLEQVRDSARATHSRALPACPRTHAKASAHAHVLLACVGMRMQAGMQADVLQR